MKPSIRWGIIGAGNVTEVKSGPAFQKARGSTLSMVMRRNEEKAEDYARRHGVPKWTTDAQILIHDPEVDAIYIATPPSSHKMYTLMAAQAGKPVYVEKPMALNYGECQEMIAACLAGGVPLFVAYYRRALPRFRKIKELVDNKAVGEVRQVHIRLAQSPLALEPGSSQKGVEALPWRVMPEIAGGGFFVDLACHTLDFLDYALGPVVEAKGIASNQLGLYPAEDMVNAVFQLASGAHMIGSWSFTTYESAEQAETDQVEIIGSQGKITFSTFGTEPVRLETKTGTKTFAIPHPAHIQQPLIQTIVDTISYKGNLCPSTGESAARTSWVMDQILKDYYRG